jgi:hypothetical protein
MTEPLVVEFEVRATPEHALDVWTRRAALWWPRSHTLSGQPESIMFEPRPGGRVVERAANGVEFEWGEVLDWGAANPGALPVASVFDRSEATEVELTFTVVPDGTQVRLEHRGWDRLGDVDPPRRTRTGQVWAELTQSYREAVISG